MVHVEEVCVSPLVIISYVLAIAMARLLRGDSLKHLGVPFYQSGHIADRITPQLRNCRVMVCTI